MKKATIGKKSVEKVEIAPSINTKPVSTTKLPAKPGTNMPPTTSNRLIKQSKPSLPPQVKSSVLKSKAVVSKPKRQKVVGGISWSKLTFEYLLGIAQYACEDLMQVYKLSVVCRVWRMHLTDEDGMCFWSHVKGGSQIMNFGDLKTVLQKLLLLQQEKRSFEFEKMFTKLFNYGSTKENIPNKLISKLELQVRIKLNKLPIKSYPFKLRNFNFSSYVFAKITDLNQFKYDFTTAHNMFKDNLLIEIQFHSRRYRAKHTISKKYVPEEIVECAIRQKAFNYYLDKNIILTFFEGDDNFLYLFYQISALELVEAFRKEIKQKNKQTLQRNMKRLPKYKQLCDTQFEDFVQYVKFQADFQLHLSYHNSLKQIFTHCDTKVYPFEYDKKKAMFHVKVEDSFDSATTFKLDNKMGMSEDVPNLYLLDFVLKDRDRFLIVFSGFIYARNAVQKQRESIENYFQYGEKQMRILEYKGPKYEFSIIMVEEGTRSLMKHIDFILYS